MAPKDEATAKVIATLSEDEQAALPSRLRSLTADAEVRAWNDAKAERDEAIAAAWNIADLDARQEALEAAAAAWRRFKAKAGKGK